MNLVDLAFCTDQQVIAFTYYDEQRGGVYLAEIHPLRCVVDPIITGLTTCRKGVQSFRIEKTRVGTRFLPHHFVVGGTTILIGEGFLREEWTVRGGLMVKSDQSLATRLRHVGCQQTGISLSH